MILELYTVLLGYLDDLRLDLLKGGVPTFSIFLLMILFKLEWLLILGSLISFNGYKFLNCESSELYTILLD